MNTHSAHRPATNSRLAPDSKSKHRDCHYNNGCLQQLKRLASECVLQQSIAIAFREASLRSLHYFLYSLNTRLRGHDGTVFKFLY